MIGLLINQPEVCHEPYLKIEKGKVLGLGYNCFGKSSQPACSKRADSIERVVLATAVLIGLIVNLYASNRSDKLSVGPAVAVRKGGSE